MVLINPCPSIFVWTFTCHYTCSIVLSMQIIIVHPNVTVAGTFVLATLLPLLGQYMVALIFARVMKLFRICSYLCNTILPSILARLHKRFTSSKHLSNHQLALTFPCWPCHIIGILFHEWNGVISTWWSTWLNYIDFLVVWPLSFLFCVGIFVLWPISLLDLSFALYNTLPSCTADKCSISGWSTRFLRCSSTLWFFTCISIQC